MKQETLPAAGQTKESQRKELEYKIQSLEAQLKIARSQLELIVASESKPQTPITGGADAPKTKTGNQPAGGKTEQQGGETTEKKSFWGKAASK
jgi:hypothetical protein